MFELPNGHHAFDGAASSGAGAASSGAGAASSGAGAASSDTGAASSGAGAWNVTPAASSPTFSRLPFESRL